MKYLNLNGNITIIAQAIIPVDNGAFRYGYGLYETMMVKNGAICLKEYHWDRLFSGLRQLYFDVPSFMNPAWLEEEVLCIARKNLTEKLCRVRLQMFSHEGGLYSSENNNPGYIIECLPLDSEMIKFNEVGLVAGIATDLNKSLDTLSNVKSCNALIYAMGARQAREQKWNDALITNTNGHVIESLVANIFWIKDDQIYTPPLSDGCVAGVMRRHVMHKLDNVREKSLTINELMDADEIFLTNAIKKIRWVGRVENRQYASEHTRAIHDLI